MLYIVQNNIFRNENYDVIFKALDKLELDYEVVEYKEGGFNFTTERKDVFAFGSLRLANEASKQGWYPGSFYGGDHDYSVYKEHYKYNLLNYECKVQLISQDIEWDYNELKFIRPCKDNKLFVGGVYTKTKWEDKLLQISAEKDEIQVNKVKEIYKEARVWIVGGKVITSSYYKFSSNSIYEETVDEEGLQFAQEMVSIFQPADSFVMDICLTPDGWKIVELNCINCSGFYKGDMQKLLIALEERYDRGYKY